MATTTKVGDVFLVPIGDGNYGLGQIAGKWEAELYAVIYDFISLSEHIDPREVLTAQPLFAALTLDAKLWHGHWPIIGNELENLTAMPQPTYKVRQGGIMYFETRDRSISRVASPEESEKLKFRTVVAPIRLENALKAHNGLGEWNPKYEELGFDYARESSKFNPVRR